MKRLREYEEILKIRYLKLYGKVDYEQKIKKERQKLLLELILTVVIFSLIIGNDIASARNEYSHVEFNNEGQITAIVRPDSEDGSYSFTTKVRIISDEGEREKEYYITIEPAGESENQQEEQSINELPEETAADNELKRLISNLNDDTTERQIYLPETLENGDELVWMKADNTDPAAYLVGMIVIAFLIYRNRFYAINREEKAARESIIKELPEFINKLVLLINAGVILNTAFLKVVDDCDEKKIQNSYFYSRMSDIGYLVRETNAPFHNEMYSFAKNSGVKEMMRITNIMMDNLSKGDDLSDKLRRENELLWFARKQQAEEKGRLAETKLTMPLMLMLAVLIMVTIAPALMEI